jgi:UDP-glucose:(heptosyl)LPS alpha-1,3-glucosyltransferase
MAECHVVPIPTRPALLRIASLWAESLVLTRRKPGEIVHVQGADAPVADIVTAHFCNRAMLARSDGASLYRRFNYLIGVAVEKYTMSKRSTKKVIAVSHTLRHEIEVQYAVPSNKVVVIHHGVDVEAFHPRNRFRWRAETRDRLGLSPNEFVILFVGGDLRRKGFPTLLRATVELPGRVRVVVVGSSGKELVSSPVSPATNGRGSAVLFVDVTLDMTPLYAMADCFVLPTHYDPFSLATLEAMASGLPVVVSRCAGVSELLTPGVDSVILESAEDDQALRAHLMRMITDDDYRTALGHQARRTAEAHTWDAVVERTLRVYRAVCETPES